MLITGIKGGLMPVITPRLTGHNARRWPGIIGAGWRKNEVPKPGIRDSKQRVVRFPRFARAMLSMITSIRVSKK